MNYVNAGSHPSALDTNKKLQEGISKDLQSILSFLDTLEVKEVDLEKEPASEDLEREMDRYFETMQVLEHENIFEDTFQRIAKHFFKLGLKAKQG